MNYFKDFTRIDVFKLYIMITNTRKYLAKDRRTEPLTHFDLFDRFAQTWENQRRGTQKIRKGWHEAPFFVLSKWR